MLSTTTAWCVNPSLCSKVQCLGWIPWHRDRASEAIWHQESLRMSPPSQLPLTCPHLRWSKYRNHPVGLQCPTGTIRIQKELLSREVLGPGKGWALEQRKAATFFIIFSHFSQSAVSQAGGTDWYMHIVHSKQRYSLGWSQNHLSYIKPPFDRAMEVLSGLLI